MDEILLKKFEKPDEERKFEKGKLELVTIGGVTVGRASYEPGWKWSEHVRPISGTELCEVEHIGLALKGRCAVRMRDGKEIVLKPGDLFTSSRGTIVGWWATSRMSPSIFWARGSTRNEMILL